MDAPVRVGIIGTGRHGSRYAGHVLHDVPELELAAVSRRSPEGELQAREWGSDYYSDWRDLVKSPDVEAVIAVTTPNLHVAIAEDCVRAGKPLLIEKPLAVNAQAAGEMVEMFRQAELPLTISQTLRYNATILALRRELHRAGELYSFHAAQRLEPTLHEWLDNPEIAGAGVVLHSAVHLFDALRFITGREVRRVRAACFRRHNSRLEDLFAAMMEMDGGLVGTVDASKLGPARSGRFEFVGSKGQLQGDQVHGFIEFVREATIEPILRTKPVSTIVPLLTGWAVMLIKHGVNPIPGEEGLAAVRICEACLQSAAEDRWVEL